MRNSRRLAALMAAVAVVFGLAACAGAGGAGAAPEEAAVYTVDIKQPFTGHEVRDASELDKYVDDAVALYNKRKGRMAKDAEESELASKANPNFKKANDSYANGDYEQAVKLYRSILKTDPFHYGASVNLTLALLQQEKNDEALIQALSCLAVSPDEEGIALNIQAAGVACGFSTEDLEGAMDATLEKLDIQSSVNKENRNDRFTSLYAYNKLWDRIETELYQGNIEDQQEDEAAEEASESEADAEATEASEDTEASEAEKASAEGSPADTALANNRAYDTLNHDMESLVDEMSGDTDATALHAYLYVVGLQLGCEADPSLIEPMHTMPYIAVDSDICTIDIKQLTSVDDGWHLDFDLTNKLADDRMSIGHGGLWLVNGSEVTTHLSEVVLEPGETKSITLEFGRMGDAGEQEATSLLGTFVITSRTSNSILVRYPVSWEAAE